MLSQAIAKKSMIARQASCGLAVGAHHQHRVHCRAQRQPEGMNTIAYNTSKGAVLNFTRALAAEWGKYNINVNAICPGFFPSKMTAWHAQGAG
jgi:NAD(P)-dependent dehydrogenase (short-subunit alcohol dehydrogenase family)